MEPLFREQDFRYTSLGSDLDRAASMALRPVYEDFRRLGCSPRDIHHIMLGAAWDLMLNDLILNFNQPFTKGEPS